MDNVFSERDGYHSPIYTYPREVWDAKKCEKLARRIAKDGMGTPYHFRGYIGNMIGTTQRFNGGTVIDNEWYQSVEYPLPEVAEGYKIVNRPTWGWQIVKI